MKPLVRCRIGDGGAKLSDMPSVTLKAHFDGERIQLDEPFDLSPDSRLLVTMLEPEEEERAARDILGRQALARAYGDGEPEYTPDDVKKQ